jgi:hypothetical protein
LTSGERFRRLALAARLVTRLGPGDGGTVALSAGLLAWYRLRALLAGGGHRLLARELAPDRESGAGPAGGRAEEASRLARLFHGAASRPVIGGSCIPRSLALARLLRLHGLAARVRVGLRRDGGDLAGHAWVEHHGAVLDDREEWIRGFAPLRAARGDDLE